MTIKAVVFDIGGVLEFNPRTGWVQKWDARLPMTMAELVEKLDSTGRNGQTGTCTLEAWQAGVLEITGITQADLDEMMVDLWEEYVGTLNTEVTRYFAALRPRYKTGILSNSFVGAREKECPLYHFDELTDDLIYSHEVGLAKPDRRIFELTCQRMNVAPHEMLFLDDVEANINAAREYGIQTIQFIDTAQALADVRAFLQAHS